MRGLINRAVQSFVQETYGDAMWRRTAHDAGLDDDSIEGLIYNNRERTEALFAAAARNLDRSREMLLEDVGTFLVSSARNPTVRRLLRFGGRTLTEFLYSLEELPGRIRLAMPEIDLPLLEVSQPENTIFEIKTSRLPGSGYVLTGILRAMADDYGALVLLDHECLPEEVEKITLHLLDSQFNAAKTFDLAPAWGA